MNKFYTLTFLFYALLLFPLNSKSQDISKIKLDSIQTEEMMELSKDLEFGLMEYFEDMKKYIQFNYPSLKEFKLEDIFMLKKALNPLHYRHILKFENQEQFFILTASKMFEFREEAMEYWISGAQKETTDIMKENIINFNALLFADAYLSKSMVNETNKEYLDAEVFDDILFKSINREDYIKYLNFIILNSSTLLYK